MARDPYDAHVAFDDVLGDDTLHGSIPYIPGVGIPGVPIIGSESSILGDTFIDLKGAVLQRLRKHRFGRPIKHTILGGVEDTTQWSFDVLGHHIIGADTIVGEGEYPLYDLLRVRFRKAIGKPKLLRVDDQETYEIFRAGRREPYLASLDERLAKLEHQFADHASDDHGGGNFSRLERQLLSHTQDPSAHLKPQPPYDFVGAFIDETMRGGQHVDLGLPWAAKKKVECWVDGDEVLVSARLPQGIATTGTSLQGEVEEVVGCAEAIGCCGLEALLLGCQIAPVTAGKKLLGELCTVSPDIDCLGVSEMKPDADAGVAAAMALLQRCQSGDKQACREALSIAHGSGRDLLQHAKAKLLHGQKQKGRLRS